ncbi:unnamed protein product, partial [Adineta ricciae]
IQKHRLQCSKEEPSCLLSAAVGDFSRQCVTNNRDEYSAEMSLQLSNSLCIIDNPLACAVVKQYIEQSSVFSSVINTIDNNAATSSGLLTSNAHPLDSLFWNDSCVVFHILIPYELH